MLILFTVIFRNPTLLRDHQNRTSKQHKCEKQILGLLSRKRTTLCLQKFCTCWVCRRLRFKSERLIIG